MLNSLPGPYLGAQNPPDGRHAKTPRDRYILQQTEDLVAELESGGGQARWKALQIEGAEEAAGETWDEAWALFASYADEEEGFAAVYEQFDPDLAQYIADAVEAQRVALFAEQAEELAASRAA